MSFLRILLRCLIFRESTSAFFLPAPQRIQSGGEIGGEVEYSIEGAREGSVHPSRADPRELTLPWASRSLLQPGAAVPDCDGYGHADVYARGATTPICRGAGINATVRIPSVGVNSGAGKRPNASRGAKGSGLDFELSDFRGRIVAIDDPIRYEYDGRGDLVSMTDRVGNATQFTYRTDKPHYLDTVTKGGKGMG